MNIENRNRVADIIEQIDKNRMLHSEITTATLSVRIYNLFKDNIVTYKSTENTLTHKYIKSIVEQLDNEHLTLLKELETL